MASFQVHILIQIAEDSMNTFSFLFINFNRLLPFLEPSLKSSGGAEDSLMCSPNLKTLHQSQKSMQMLVDFTSTKISDSDKRKQAHEMPNKPASKQTV